MKRYFIHHLPENDYTTAICHNDAAWMNFKLTEISAVFEKIRSFEAVPFEKMNIYAIDNK